MPNWIQITPEDLRAYLNAPQLEALRTSALAYGQPDPLPRILGDIAAFVRASVLAQPHHRLDVNPAAVPPELVEATAVLALEAASLRLPGLELSREQERRIREARRLLRDVARGRLAITRPDNALAPDAYQSASAISVEHSRAHPVDGATLHRL
jgi:hypothetical protein